MRNKIAQLLFRWAVKILLAGKYGEVNVTLNGNSIGTIVKEKK